ncbi:hypothetical protein [Halorhabdus rudnickae]|uniref:hypothetical protein n=1 Tax=Halorhabdus rudnickae TaxID=1775544 RepID=UPI001AEF761A|nr:hypothetical protein [Halorhabdus rudnickae]
MSLFKRLLGKEETGLETIQADADLFTDLQEHLPDQPLIRLRPHEDNPGLSNAKGLIRSLYHYRKDGYGRNDSPINSFEIWFDEGEVRFYFHPDTREMKNSGKKHFEDQYPGTRMVEEQDPFPEINEGDYIAAAEMTLSNHFARPLKTVEGPQSFDRDPHGSLTSEMVVENERTTAGERVKGEKVKMVVQVVFQPISRSWSRGGLFGTNLNDYADDLKKPKQKGDSMSQFMRAVVGLEPAMREPTQKMRKSARMISELKGEPAFLTDIRIIGISPYDEISRQHVGGVVEEFENFNNPVTEQTLQMRRLNEEEIQTTLEMAAARDLPSSTLGKISAMKDVLTVPELAGIVHIPNKDIHTPNVDWTKMEKGSGVPTSIPGLDDVQKEMQASVDNPAEAARAESEEDADSRMVAVDEHDEAAEDIDLTIESEDDVFEEPGSGLRSAADGRGLNTDQAIEEENEEGNEDPGSQSSDSTEPNEESGEDSGWLDLGLTEEEGDEE